MKDLQNLIDLAKQVAKPAYIAVWILSALLFVSVCGNVYQATSGVEVVIEQEYKDSNENIVDVK